MKKMYYKLTILILMPFILLNMLVACKKADSTEPKPSESKSNTGMTAKISTSATPVNKNQPSKTTTANKTENTAGVIGDTGNISVEQDAADVYDNEQNKNENVPTVESKHMDLGGRTLKFIHADNNLPSGDDNATPLSY